MKEIRLFTLLAVLTFSPIFANSWRVLSNTCQNRINFLGLVTVWSGSITYAEYDNFGNPTGNTRIEKCTEDGNWDWFW